MVYNRVRVRASAERNGKPMWKWTSTSDVPTWSGWTGLSSEIGFGTPLLTCICHFADMGEEHSKQSMIGRLTSVRLLFNCYFVTFIWGTCRARAMDWGRRGYSWRMEWGWNFDCLSCQSTVGPPVCRWFLVGGGGNIRGYLRTSNLLQFCIKYVELGIHQRSPCTTRWSDLTNQTKSNQTKRIQARKHAVEAVSCWANIH